jgi:large subunit ribosomal protein L32e
MKTAIKSSLKLRRKQKRKKPTFSRQEGYRMKKLKEGWRKPKGRHSKLRQKEKPKGKHPSPGYGSPAATRGLSRSGLKEVIVSTPSQLKGINPKTEAALIAGAVGKAKRAAILEQAKKTGIKVLNI